MYIDVSIEEHQKRELGLAQQKQDPDQCSGAGVCVTKHRGGLLKNCWWIIRRLAAEQRRRSWIKPGQNSRASNEPSQKSS